MAVDVGHWDVEGRLPYSSRATGVSATTIGTPAARASSGVSPNPSYSDRKTKNPSLVVQRGELVFRDVRAKRHVVLHAGLGRDRCQVLSWVGAISSDDGQLCVWYESPNFGQRADQCGQVAAVEGRTPT